MPGEVSDILNTKIMYSTNGIKEILNVNWITVQEVVESFKIKPNEKGLFSYDQMNYISQCYNLKKESGLQYSFIKKMPIRLIKELIRMNEDPDKELRRLRRKEYDKQRYLKKTE